MSDPDLVGLNKLLPAGTTREQINRMNPLDLIGAIAPELQEQILAPIFSRGLRGRFAKILLAEQFGDPFQQYMAMDRATKHLLSFIQLKQDNVDLQSDRNIRLGVDERQAFYTDSPVVRYDDGETSMTESGGFDFGSDFLAKRTGTFPNRGGSLPVHRILDPTDDEDTILDLVKGSPQQQQELAQIDDEIRQVSERLKEYTGGGIFSEDQAEELIDDKLDEFLGTPQVTGLSDINMTWSDPYNRLARHVGKREDYQEEMKSIYEQVNNVFGNFLGDENSPDDLGTAEEYLQEVTDLENYLDDPELFPLDDDNIYKQAADNGDLDLNDVEGLRDHVDELSFLKGRITELASYAPFSDESYIISQESINEKHQEHMTAARNYLEELQDAVQFVENPADFGNIDNDDFDELFAQGNFTDAEKEELRITYRDEDLVDEED